MWHFSGWLVFKYYVTSPISKICIVKNFVPSFYYTGKKKVHLCENFFKHYIIKVTFQSVTDHRNLKNSGIFCNFQKQVSFFSFFPRHNLLFWLYPSWPGYTSQGKIHKIFSSFYVLSFAFFTRSCHDIQLTSEKSMSSSKGFDFATNLLGQ